MLPLRLRPRESGVKGDKAREAHGVRDGAQPMTAGKDARADRGARGFHLQGGSGGIGRVLRSNAWLGY